MLKIDENVLKKSYLHLLQPHFGEHRFPLLFKYLNVFGTGIWERVKLGSPKEESQKLVLTIFGIADLLERVL